MGLCFSIQTINQYMLDNHKSHFFLTNWNINNFQWSVYFVHSDNVVNQECTGVFFHIIFGALDFFVFPVDFFKKCIGCKYLYHLSSLFYKPWHDVDFDPFYSSSSQERKILSGCIFMVSDPSLLVEFACLLATGSLQQKQRVPSQFIDHPTSWCI